MHGFGDGNGFLAGFEELADLIGDCAEGWREGAGVWVCFMRSSHFQVCVNTRFRVAGGSG